jgi:hypothetical protein
LLSRPGFTRPFLPILESYFGWHACACCRPRNIAPRLKLVKRIIEAIGHADGGTGYAHPFVCFSLRRRHATATNLELKAESALSP